MSLPFHLGLRGNQHLVSLMKMQGSPWEVLGIAYPDDLHQRIRILANWAIEAQSPRCPETTATQPAAPRAQVILSYRLNKQLRNMLNRSASQLTQSRRDDEPGVKQRAHLGVDHAVLAVDSRRGIHGSSGLPATSGTRAQHGVANTSGRR